MEPRGETDTCPSHAVPTVLSTLCQRPPFSRLASSRAVRRLSHGTTRCIPTQPDTATWHPNMRGSCTLCDEDLYLWRRYHTMINRQVHVYYLENPDLPIKLSLPFPRLFKFTYYSITANWPNLSPPLPIIPLTALNSWKIKYVVGRCGFCGVYTSPHLLLLPGFIGTSKKTKKCRLGLHGINFKWSGERNNHYNNIIYNVGNNELTSYKHM